MNVSFKQFVGCSCAGLGVALLLILLLIFGFERELWPKIEDEAKLLRDCQTVMSLYPSASAVPRTDWPASIRQLNPLAVIKGDEYVEIVVSGGGIGEPYSYVVFRTTDAAKAFTVPSRKLRRTKNPLIYRLA